MGFVKELEEYLAASGLQLDEAGPDELESFVADVESEGESAKLHLWGIHYYYEFIDDPIMTYHAAEMRQERVEEAPFRLRQFRGVNQEGCDRLRAIGVSSTGDLLAVATTSAGRRVLAAEAGVDIEVVEELTSLSDLARIDGIKSIRARLYHDAGITSVRALASWDPRDLVAHLRAFVDVTGFAGIAPLPGEALRAVSMAKKLPDVIE
jgi:predicted flap endonuclease-1-like 5' DNA nuclease